MSAATKLHPPEVGDHCIIAPDVTLGQGTVVSNYVILDNGVTVGRECWVWNHVRLREGVRLGDNVSVGDGAHLGPGVTVGNGSRIGNYAQVHHPAVIGRRVFLGPNAFLSNDRYPQVGTKWCPEGVTVHDDACIGANAVIMAGLTIGRGGVVGAGAVVLQDVPDGIIVCGNPALAKRARDVHWPGTAHDHFAPYSPEGSHQRYCPLCDLFGVEQYEPWFDRMAKED